MKGNFSQNELIFTNNVAFPSFENLDEEDDNGDEIGDDSQSQNSGDRLFTPGNKRSRSDIYNDERNYEGYNDENDYEEGRGSSYRGSYSSSCTS